MCSKDKINEYLLLGFDICWIGRQKHIYKQHGKNSSIKFLFNLNFCFELSQYL